VNGRFAEFLGVVVALSAATLIFNLGRALATRALFQPDMMRAILGNDERRSWGIYVGAPITYWLAARLPWFGMLLVVGAFVGAMWRGGGTFDEYFLWWGAFFAPVTATWIGYSIISSRLGYRRLQRLISTRDHSAIKKGRPGFIFFSLTLIALIVGSVVAGDRPATRAERRGEQSAAIERRSE
jgi:hypothetical protein